MTDLRINDRLTIPPGELEERFTTSGGPGGQHANRASTRVILSFDLASSSVLDDSTRAQLTRRLGSRLRGGVLTVTAEDSRSQWRNRQMARGRLAETLRDALRPEIRRVPTRPSRTAKRKRVDDKKARGKIKQLRRKPDVE